MSRSGASAPIGILVMAYGTATGPDDVERYYTDIRGGRPPSPEHLEELRARYAAIGNRFPLLDVTRRQAEALERRLNAAAETGDGEGSLRFRAFLGMKHSPPFIPEGVAAMRDQGIERAVGLVMAPHWSGMSVQTYVERVERAVAEDGGPWFTFVPHWYDHPAFVSFLSSRVSDALSRVDPERRRGGPTQGPGSGVAVIFSAHSLPQRRAGDGTTRCLRCHRCPDRCAYPYQLEHTADLVAERVGLARGSYTIGWQSAGRTPDPWLGPPVDAVIRDLAAAGRWAVVVCSAGFVADHLEILYDLDIEARAVAEGAGMAFARSEMPNDDPAFVEALAEVVRDHLAAPDGGPALASDRLMGTVAD